MRVQQKSESSLLWFVSKKDMKSISVLLSSSNLWSGVSKDVEPQTYGLTVH